MTSITCFHCNITFLRKTSAVNTDKRTYCSRTCAAIVNNKEFVKRKRTVNLTPKSSTPRVYTKNRGSLTVGELLSTLSKKKTSEVIRHHCRSFNKSRSNNPCDRCGFSEYTELAHIIPIAEFLNKSEATLSEINSITNVIPLCPNCHKLFDLGKITIGGAPESRTPQPKLPL